MKTILGKRLINHMNYHLKPFLEAMEISEVLGPQRLSLTLRTRVKKKKLGMVTGTFKPGTGEAETGRQAGPWGSVAS